jgi:MYXO-CTERM domain-containing protein
MRLLPLLIALIPSVSFAHISMTYPPPRTANQKLRACGDAKVRGTNVTTLAPGATLTVIWKETVDHPGHFRISFDVDGQDFSIPPDTTTTTFGSDPNVLLDLIPDVQGNNPPGGRTYSQDVTLPNVECTNCTLQLIQLMTDHGAYTEPQGEGDDIYYQCADLTLSASAPDAGIPVVDADVPGEEAGANPATGEGGGGCCSTGGGGGAGSFGLAAIALAAILRRRRQG